MSQSRGSRGRGGPLPKGIGGQSRSGGFRGRGGHLPRAVGSVRRGERGAPFDEPQVYPPVQLSKVKLEQFKAAFRPKPVSLGTFNVVIGRNGSGKSTLLEALQWLDITIRRDAREASDRYFGISDLINLRSSSPFFRLNLDWSSVGIGPQWQYGLQVVNEMGAPWVSEEELVLHVSAGGLKRKYIATTGGKRWVQTDGQPNAPGRFPVVDTDRVALDRVADADHSMESPKPLVDFWKRAVFLRLSASRLAAGSLSTRKSFEPMLDEEGQTLPALLSELDSEQRQELVSKVKAVLPRVRGVRVSTPGDDRAMHVHYSLVERLLQKARDGKREFPIPAWMLSEGTRRITAILALLVRQPPPSLLCIEEIENGLDPISVKCILRHLQAAADAGTQVIVTTHSPWLLDEVPLDSIIEVRRTTSGDVQYLRFAERPEVKAYHSSVPAGTRYVQELM